MDDTITLTFNGDDSALGDLIYIDRKAFTQYTDSMNHTEEDAFGKHLDDLMEACNRADLAKYPFISFAKPADFDRKKYCVEPLGQDHAEWRFDNEEIKTLTAVSRAKHHFHLMWLCGHPQEIRKLHEELQMSPEDFCKVRGITDPERARILRDGIAGTIRQVERMIRKYSAEEIAAANAFIDEANRGQSEI